ncbi:MAG: glycosyltransferase family 4 protein [Candidatus Hydrothermia bacterium]
MNFVFPLLSFKKHGGVRVLAILMNGLAEKGFKVTLIVPKNRFEDFYSLNDKVNIKFVESKRQGKDPLSLLSILFQLYRNIPPHSYVVVSFFPTFYPAFFAKLFKSARITYLRQDAEQYFYPFPFSLLAYLSYFLPQDYRPAVSRWVMRGTLSKGPIIHPPLSRDFLSQPLNTHGKENAIVIFVRLKKRKGAGISMELLKHNGLKDFTFYIIGDSPGALDSRKFYLGYLKTKELIEILDRARFFILPSLREGFGLPPLEAMSRGVVPIVFTKTGPAEYIINEYNGFLAKSVDDAVRIIKSLSHDTQKWNIISQNAAKTAHLFTEEKFIGNFIEMLK